MAGGRWGATTPGNHSLWRRLLRRWRLGRSTSQAESLRKPRLAEIDRWRSWRSPWGRKGNNRRIVDRIADLTGVEGFLERQKLGGLDRLKAKLGLWKPTAEQGSRDIGGRLFLDPKFPVNHFRGKRCLDIGCGAGRWTRTLITLGATVKSVDMSEHGLQSTRRFNTDVEKLNLFDILPQRLDLHEAFDFTLCWGVVMCTHDPLRAFENVARTARPGGEIYIMVYAPTYHSSDYVLNARRRFHRECRTDHEKLDFVYDLAGEDRANAINYLDML
ncbi:MAG: class I SAM-dependent methyltransferase, partial [Roseomonas sp.]|nr:class I SAM-dependent methyltransferase [Roseomonas sp.]